MVDGRSPETKEKERETLDTVNVLVIVYKSTVGHTGIYACGHRVRLGDYESLSGGGRSKKFTRVNKPTYIRSSAMCRRSFRRRFAYAKRFLFV